MAKSIKEALKQAEAAKAARNANPSGDMGKLAPKVIQTSAAGWAQSLPGVTPLPVDGNQERRCDAGAAAAAFSRPDPARTALSRPHGFAEAHATKMLQAKRRAHVPKAPPRYPHLRSSPPRPAAVADGVKLSISPEAALNWAGGQPVTASLLRQAAELGRRTQLLQGAPSSSREVVMGFDFGTSSAKVVLGDRGLKQAYAVPFRDAPSVDAYLLPARLYEDAGRFSLHGGPRNWSDLKLSLMADPDSATLQVRVVGYLALAIREARGWLFTTHAESYARTEIVWTLALGQPADQATPGALTQLFQRLGRAAWKVAGESSDVMSSLCAKALQSASDQSGAEPELEVNVMPEIAAQIYGFVSSTQFDPKSRNIFLIADVGAGTVDSCLFRVVPARAGTWSFEVYTAAVEPAGVMNLHRHRVDWWQRQLAQHPQGAELISQLGAIKLATEHQAVLPDSYQSYLKGVSVEYTGKMDGPDRSFFRSPLLRQVQGRTLYKAFGAGLLGQNDLGDVPFFLCGGGSRMSFYRDLRGALREYRNFTWLAAQSRELAIPSDLRADGLMRSDYDRLSVAYGLSMLNLAGVAAAAQIPRMAPEASNRWRSHYVDKDQV